MERIQYILTDTGAKVIISNENHQDILKGVLASDTVNIVIDDSTTQKKIAMQECINYNHNTATDDLAYVIYTSGTTGQPKGVMVEHKSVISFHSNIKRKYFNSEGVESILFLSNYVFDFSIEQILLSILNSNKMVLVKNDFNIDNEFYQYVNENNLSFLSGTPTFLMQIDISRISNLKVLLVAGEAFTEGQYNKFRQKFHGKIIQAYGHYRDNCLQYCQNI